METQKVNQLANSDYLNSLIYWIARRQEKTIPEFISTKNGSEEIKWRQEWIRYLNHKLNVIEAVLKRESRRQP